MADRKTMLQNRRAHNAQMRREEWTHHMVMNPEFTKSKKFPMLSYEVQVTETQL